MSKTADDFKNEGNQFLRQRKFKEALDKYTEGITLAPDNHILFSNRSLCYLQLSNFDEALKDASECIKLKPDWFKGYLRKAAVYQKQEILHEALSCLDKGIGACTEGKEKLTGLFTTISSSLATNPKMAYQLNAFQVHKIFNIPDFEENFIKQHPQQARMLLKNPMFKMKLEKIQGSTTDTLDFLKDPQVELALGILTGQLAQQERQKEMKAKREAAEAERRRQQVREQEEKRRKEKEELKRKEDEKPENQEKLKGNQAFKKGEYEEAMKNYQKAIELNEKECTFHFNISACFLSMEKYEEAIKAAEEGLEKGKKVVDDPLIFEKIAKGYARLGNVYFRQKKYKDAIEQYKLSMTESKTKLVARKITECEKRIKKEEMEAYFDEGKSKEAKGKGNSLFKGKRFSEAIPHYREAIKRNPSDPSLFLNMGTCYLKMGQFPTAIKNFDKAIELDPKYEKAYNRASQCHIQHFMILSPQEKGVKGLNLLMKASQVVAKGLNNVGQESVMLQTAMKQIYQYISLFQQKN